MQVTIAGSGGWGTALAILLHENGHDVTLWSHFETESKQLAETHQNPYLPGVTLPEGLHYSADPACAQGREMVVFATPSFAVRTTAPVSYTHLDVYKRQRRSRAPWASRSTSTS